MLRSLCVFCGSSPGRDPAYRSAATALGRQLASDGIRLIFGAGKVGLMGVIADAVLGAGGEAVGVIPQHLVDREVAHGTLTELHVVASMHERKAMMADLSDGFVAMPGGIGTLEEFFEIWTWGQLGLHQKPYALLNVNGFYDPLITFLDQLVDQRFVKPEFRQLLIVETDPARLPSRMADQRVPSVPKWIDHHAT